MHLPETGEIRHFGAPATLQILSIPTNPTAMNFTLYFE